jgi:hypothetical protein
MQAGEIGPSIYLFRRLRPMCLLQHFVFLSTGWESFSSLQRLFCRRACAAVIISKQVEQLQLALK